MPRSAVSPTAVTVSAVVSSIPCRYHGFTLRETGGTIGAVVRVYDNASAASGTILDTIALAAGESAREFYPVEDDRGGLRAANGVYFSVVSGAVEGSIRTS